MEVRVRAASRKQMKVWKKVLRRVQVCIDEYLRNRSSNKYIIILILIPSVNLVLLYHYFGH